MTQQVSPRPIKCQSRLWSQRGTKVSGSHHGDNPLLRPTGIQIATKSYAALQAMAPTNIKTVHQTSLLLIESNLDRLGMLSPTHDQRSQQKKRKNYAPTSFDQQVQVSQGHTFCTEIGKLKYRGPFSRTGVQPSPDSSTIELPSAFAESGAYPPDSRVLPGSPRQCSLPLACRHPPEGHQIGAREEARTWEHHHPQPTIPPPRLNRQAESRRQPVGCIS